MFSRSVKAEARKAGMVRLMAITLSTVSVADPRPVASWTICADTMDWKPSRPSAGDLLIFMFSRPAGEILGSGDLIWHESYLEEMPEVKGFFTSTYSPGNPYYTFTAPGESPEGWFMGAWSADVTPASGEGSWRTSETRPLTPADQFAMAVLSVPQGRDAVPCEQPGCISCNDGAVP
jgi:hypothetical protein